MTADKMKELERIKKLKMKDNALKELSNFVQSLDENEKREFAENILKELPELEKIFTLIAGKLIDIYGPISKTKTKRKPKKKSIKETKKYEYASGFNSLLIEEVFKNHKAYKIQPKNNKYEVESVKKENDIGEFCLIKELGECSLDDKDIMNTIIEKYRDRHLYFDRIDIQIFYALMSIYLQNTTRKQQEIGEAILINTKDLHYNILGKTGELQKRDLLNYEKIFRGIASQRIHYTSNNASSTKYKKFKNVDIDAPLLNIDIISLDDYKEQAVRVQPTAYTLFEMNKIKQFNNCLDWNIFKLPDRKEYDNVFYFYMYISRLHRNNQKQKQKAFAMSPYIKTLVKEALPDGEKLIEQFKTERRKSRFIQLNIENPLKETIKILEESKTIKPLKNRFNFNDSYKNIFDENEKNKIMIHFNYEF